MLFTEPTFLFFFLPLLLLAHALSPNGLRNTLLATASLVFYAWAYLPHVFLLLGSIVFNYLVGMAIDRAGTSRGRRTVLSLGIVGNLAMLAWFKYAGFLVANLNPLLTSVGVDPLPPPQVDLPLGVSFFTFQAVSYVVDVYRRETPAQRNLIDLALFISLFPQLIAGPIVRYRELAGQLKGRSLPPRGFSVGIQRFTIGLAKKLLLANTLARGADQVFALPGHELTPELAWMSLICYTLQIYFDFSGYSDMAVGLGRMFGFHLPENFNHPYMARSITEFWRRWHLTLSRWFRDYLYIPLGGNRKGRARTGLNLLVVFLLCGLWHGASWKFLVWGLFHGLFLVVERIVPRRLARLVPDWIRRVYALGLVMIGWVVFRADNLDHAVTYVGAMIGLTPGLGAWTTTAEIFPNDVLLACLVGAIAATPVDRVIRNRLAGVVRVKTPRGRRRNALRLVHAAGNCALLLLLLLSAMWIGALTYVPFIYFRF